MDALSDVVYVPDIDAGEVNPAGLGDVDMLLLGQVLHLLVCDSHRTQNSSQAQAELKAKKCRHLWGPIEVSEAASLSQGCEGSPEQSCRLIDHPVQACSGLKHRPEVRKGRVAQFWNLQLSPR